MVVLGLDGKPNLYFFFGRKVELEYSNLQVIHKIKLNRRVCNQPHIPLLGGNVVVRGGEVYAKAP